MRPESGVLPPPNLAAAVSPASTISQEPDDCYFTAKAVPIRASVALSGATSTSHLSYYYHHSPATLSTGNFTNNNSSPSPLLSPGASPLLSPNSARNSSAFVTPAEFPPPPGHSHPSFVFRRSQTASFASPSAAGGTPSSHSPAVAAKSPPVDGLRVNSTSSMIWDSSSPGLGLSLTRPPPRVEDDGSRESTTWLSSPSLLPHPPSVNGKDAHIRPLFSSARQSALSTTGTLGTTPGPTPPPKEYHPTLSPVTNDYFSPLAPMVTSFQPPAPQPPLPPQPTQQPTTLTGLSRNGKPLPLDLPGTTTTTRVGGAGGAADSTLSPISHPPPTATSQSSLLSPISQHSPVSNPALSPLTVHTLAHLSNTALRSPSLTFIDTDDEKQPMQGTIGRFGSTASRPLTGAQRDRLLQLKRDYDRRQGYGQGDEEKGGRWGVRSRDGSSSSSSARTILLALGLGLLALGGIVGIIVALTVAQGGHS
ncbi:hypothetical protein PFICI_03040 [Pestalotiopsis fici W106-1]|uniref:Uncharacterized protein n=1 Tax=Pestalotiopsis fici (strain W106-1 / CGMCC3.15140) TaxID=1229662 RepID=W3XG55_PESFW|nr:uncharacterized protein PFICI_03040 [Pestalotiopsis fici W106-1]ETS85015.1 hypothetical protein PFICI_03040 [Pestalotiopsis fici W106-1]